MKKRRTARRRTAARHVDLSRHERLCTVCSHDDREAIEEAFIHWRWFDFDDEEDDPPTQSAIYRHAHALGLFELRRHNMHFALENLIEGSHAAPATAESVIHAIRAYSCLKRNGNWVEPVTTHRAIVRVARSADSASSRDDDPSRISLLNLPSGASETRKLPAAPERRETDRETDQEDETDRESERVSAASALAPNRK
ncbi:MAG: hypothetical protein ACRD5M_14955 [Candidatus Acidiferrales bacterium]